MTQRSQALPRAHRLLLIGEHEKHALRVLDLCVHWEKFDDLLAKPFMVSSRRPACGVGMEQVKVVPESIVTSKSLTSSLVLNSETVATGAV
eukprot:CAMPEP_0194748482 /NCGR_PEP_ID=MMETSP0323_2-20130528/2607_1 /TAXON_ID=2866 ORGANISM="Crypthecodinium cohnii, Strain Seligo" /NCGR_SAMPLE_ID=MMETSP0323_2 /ASSEMBLY_ACC=CAM_ASM_000346 /LENGTH=90 /DNA_ID=CAMNT_0039662745 /DNA_START=605 /DNA_END=874 /DNA_ORIENTATION=+